MKKELYIGLDVDKDSITVAIAQGGRDGEVRLYGTISNDLDAIEKLLMRLRKAHGTDPCMEVCYEADLRQVRVEWVAALFQERFGLGFQVLSLPTSRR